MLNILTYTYRSMAKTFQDKLKANQTAKFIGRSEHLTLFKNNLEAYNPCSIINIYGQGGVGKTYLSRQYKTFAENNNCLCVYSDEGIKSVLEWMELASKQFNKQDADLSEFDKFYKTYQQETKKLEADPEKPKGTFGNIVRAVVKGTIKEAAKVPGAELLIGFIDQDGLANSLGDWADFVRKKIGNKDEVELVLEPLNVLTPLFWKGVMKYTEHKKMICFFIDTFEETDTILETWLLECLNGNHGDIPANILLIIAGRDSLNPNLWSAFTDFTETIPLEPFSEVETEDFSHSHGITDTSTKADIVRLSNRLPVLMAWLATSAKENKGHIENACETAVERFLKWVVDEKQRGIALAAALPRKLNQDIIESFLPDKTQAEAYFKWLTDQPFVLRKDDAWAYHNVVREQMLRYERTRSPKEWTTKHEALSDYYHNLQEELSIAETEQYNHTRWFDYEQERLYHALCAKPDKHIALAINGLVKKWLLDGHKSVTLFGETLYEAGSVIEHEITIGWGLRIIKSKEALNTEDESLFYALVEDILTKEFVIEGHPLAYLYNTGGINYAILKNFKKAIEYFQKAISIKSAHLSPLNNIGICYENLRNYEKAIDYYEKAISIKPDYHFAINNMGVSYRKLENYEKAIECFEKVISMKPDYYSALNNMGISYKNLGNYEKSIEYFEEAISINPIYYGAFVNMGISYQDLKNYEKAIECFNKAISIKPDYPEAFANLGYLYNNLKNYEKAIEYSEKAISINPVIPEAFINLGVSHINLKNYVKAIECFEKAIKINSVNPEVFVNMGYAFFNIKNYLMAKESFQGAIEINSKDSESHNNMGYCLIVLGNLEDAETSLNIALSLNLIAFPDRNLGHVRLAQQKKDEALAYYLKSLIAFEDKAEFWKGMEDDFQYLDQYGINRKDYDTVLAAIKSAQ